MLDGTKGRIRDIAIDPTDSNVLYLATYLENQGVLISRNGGETWTPSHPDENQVSDVYAVAIDPEMPNVIAIGTSYHGAYRSVDSGETWQHVSDGGYVSTLDFDAAMPTRLLAILERDGFAALDPQVDVSVSIVGSGPAQTAVH